MLRPALVALCAATIATGAMGQSAGIAVCDELFGKWEACLTRMPDFDRRIQKSVLDELRRSVGEQLKKDLREPAELACKTSAQQFAGAVAPYGCTLGVAPKERAKAESTGVAFCDDFIQKFESCYTSKMPADQQDLHKLTLDHMRKTVSDLARSPGGTSSAEKLCREVLVGVKGLLGSVGCTF
jgi:hypothetical protein